MPPLAPAGYSGKPLPDKLGFKDAMAVAFLRLPEDHADLSQSRDFSLVVREDNAAGLAGLERFDAIHVFVTAARDLEAELSVLQDAIRRDGFIWVSWPKKTSGVLSDMSEDVVRRVALGLDLVDVKVAAVDAVWSGLKLVIRKDRR